MTVRRPGVQGDGKMFATPQETILAYNSGAINLQAPIFVRMPNGAGKPTAFNENEHCLSYWLSGGCATRSRPSNPVGR